MMGTKLTLKLKGIDIFHKRGIVEFEAPPATVFIMTMQFLKKLNVVEHINTRELYTIAYSKYIKDRDVRSITKDSE